MSLVSTNIEPYAGGFKGGPGSLVDGNLIETIRRYRTEVAKRYRALGPEQLDTAIPAGKAWISTKLDGELWFLIKRSDATLLCAPNGRILRSTPLLAEIESKLAPLSDAVFAGELVATPPEGRARVQHVAAALTHPPLEPRLSFAPFDIVHDGDNDVLRMRYGARLTRLRGLFEGGKRVTVVTTVEGEAKEAPTYYREWVAAKGFEGIVVRSEVGLVYKAKPAFTIDAVVIAFGTRVEQGVTMLREITVALRRDDGTLQVLGPVGGGFSDDDRLHWLTRLTTLETHSRFRMANRDGTLCRFVRPEIVVEVQCTDVVETDANDAPIARMALSYSESDGYEPTGEAPIAAMLFPRFLRERTDKVPDVASIGMTQITSRVPLDAIADAWHHGPLPASEIVHRAVWTKGDTAVRKVVVIETHKEPHQGYPRFVVYGTDFSGGRAEPLKTNLRSASTRERADALVQQWIEENVKRGWNPLTTTHTHPAADANTTIAALPTAPVTQLSPTKPTPQAPDPDAGVAADAATSDGATPIRKPARRSGAKSGPDVTKAEVPAAKRKRSVKKDEH